MSEGRGTRTYMFPFLNPRVRIYPKVRIYPTTTPVQCMCCAFARMRDVKNALMSAFTSRKMILFTSHFVLFESCFRCHNFSRICTRCRAGMGFKKGGSGPLWPVCEMAMFFAFFKRISWGIGSVKVELPRSGALPLLTKQKKWPKS